MNTMFGSDPSISANVTTNILTDAAVSEPSSVSDTQIAQSLIRSMLGTNGLGSNGLDAKALSPKQLALKVPGEKQKQTPAMIASALPLQIGNALPVTLMPAGDVFQDNAGEGDPEFGGQAPKAPPAVPVMPVQPAVATGQIAFEARLISLGSLTSTAGTAPTASPDPKTQDSKSNARSMDFQTARTIARNDSQDDTPRVQATAAVYSGDPFGRSFESALPPATSHSLMDTKAPSTFGAVADTLRASETANAAAPQAATAGGIEIRDISLRIARAENPVVDLRVIERGGEIHVTVRTPDTGLETLLRRDLGALTNSLERAGYRAETYVPRTGHEMAQLLSKSAANMDQHESRESQQESYNRNQGNHGGGSNGRQDQRRQPNHQDRNQRTQNWTKEMENQR